MRLHRLEMSAFLSFAGTECVDFDVLGESGIFLIQGRTGAGKTTLLDAICFALYGDVPGARAAGVALRSDHASRDLLTRVELEVTLRGERVRVVREPEQERLKIRGDGTTKHKHSVSIVALEPGGGERVLAASHDDARTEIERLVGLEREQFCQVVMLPQGGFAKFLHATNDEREKILRNLFDASRFTRVERWLEDRARSAHDGARLAQNSLADVMAAAAVAAGCEAPDARTAAAGELTSWLQEQTVVAEASVATAAEVCRLAGEQRLAAEAALETGRTLAALQREHSAAVAELARWQARRGERDGAQGEIGAARRAEPVRSLAEAVERREAELREARAEASSALSAAGLDVEGDVTATALRDRAAQLRRDAGAAEAALPRESKLAAATAELDGLEQRHAALGADAVAATQRLESLADSRPALVGDVDAARAAADRLDGLRAAAEAASTRAVAATERDRLEAEASVLGERLLAARESLARAREHAVDLRERRLAGIAAELAGHLTDGEACSVCGSDSHPAPAEAPEGGLVAVADVDEAEEAVAAAERVRDAAAESVEQIERELAAARALSGRGAADALTAAAQRATTEAREAATLAGRLETAIAVLARADAEAAEATERRESAAQEAQGVAAQIAERKQALAADRAAVMTARGSHDTVAARIAALAAEAEAAEAAASASDTAAICERELRAAVTEADIAAHTAGFADLDAVRDALLTAAEVAALEAVVGDFDAGLVERSAAVARPDLGEAAAAAAPAMDALEAAVAGARERDAAAQGASATARSRLDDLGALGERLETALDTAGPAFDASQLIGGLADLAKGRGSNRLGMNLSSYVLAARLEEVAEAASVRLTQMSDGRYTLAHSDMRARANQRGGLGLRVTDAWTGRERDPKSLSGGETFMASLALALGLSDVVTAEAGGSRLETLFIDEGFGSLDDEGTLDQVMAVLDALREGGRTIGVVSHVAELRATIPTQLRVEKGPAGSHLIAPTATPSAGAAA